VRKFTTSIHKELLLLFRDKTGLLLLFIMPAILVLVITLIQENVLKTDIQVLFIDNDKKEIGKELSTLLESSETIQLVQQIDGAVITEKDANKAVANGSYQFCIIIPEGLSDAVNKKSLINVTNIMFEENKEAEIYIPEIKIFYDPTIQGSFKVAIESIVNRIVKGIEQKLKLKHTFKLLPEKIKLSFAEEFREYLPKDNKELLPFDKLSNSNNSIISINSIFATKMHFIKKMTSVQQNVPAWTLFGIFFIIVPIAGSLINERESGTMLRLKSMPVSYFVIILGKLTAYTLICFGQFGVILFIGKYILPLFGSPAFDAGTQYLAFFLILLSSICAATGYGILLGTIMKTYEQASMFGPVSVVIAAAIGGIMVPVYTMPEFIQPLTILSPLSWGQNAFYDILLRGGGLQSVMPEICSLFSFFIVTLFTSCFFVFYKNQYS
jgi:ABC-2 type transport system permease protein